MNSVTEWDGEEFGTTIALGYCTTSVTGAKAAASAAMLPLAPPLFSITTCWPHVSESRADTMRAIASAPPPGGNGTIRRTNRFGQFGTGKACSDEVCADVGQTRLGASAAAAASAIAWRRVIIR